MFDNVLSKLNHLSQIRSVNWKRLLRVLPQVYLDYRSGRGISNSLLNVTLEITYRCNAQCQFCFASKTLPGPTRKELSVAEIMALVKSVAPLSPGFFITGGEPFVRKDIVDVLHAFKKHHLKIGINSNMSLMNEELAQSLKDVGLNYLIASLHGPEEIHNGLVGANLHDRVLEGIKLLRATSPGTRILVNCVVTSENMGHLKALAEEVAQAGAHALTLQHETFITEEEVEAHDRVWGNLFNQEISSPLSVPVAPNKRCNAATAAQVLEEAKNHGAKVGLPVFVKPDLQQAALSEWYEERFYPRGRCSYLYTDARITPYGDVVACQSLPLVFGNIRNQPLLEIYNSETAIKFRQALQHCGGNIPGCARCCKLYRSF